MVATDVSIYIGNLVPVFSGARRVLRAGGWLGFSVEATEQPGYEFAPTRRFHGHVSKSERQAQRKR